jgi:hypothetical protein
MPSLEPEVWQPELVRSREALREGQMLIASVVLNGVVPFIANLMQVEVADSAVEDIDDDIAWLRLPALNGKWREGRSGALRRPRAGEAGANHGG